MKWTNWPTQALLRWQYLLGLGNFFPLPATGQGADPMLSSVEEGTRILHTCVTAVLDYHKSDMNYLSQINLPPRFDVIICMWIGTMEHVLYVNIKNTIMFDITK